eukprot:TRINITY_DN5011_c0_g1_i2.p1 TRINITY_DN5011_c0_g1~~TRINITY_DN5011_c0_g1_i2.p1  ORF type:complete len:468 (-),score=57.70 TRINITY_DN5011_c0_g1_i2:636-2039(-)
MISFSSAFLYALLADLTIIVSDISFVSRLFCNPLEGTSMFIADPLFNSIAHPIEENPDCRLPRYKTLRDEGKHQELPGVWFKMAYSEEEMFFCPDHQEAIQDTKFSLFRGDQWLGPPFYYLPKFKEQLDQMFPDRIVLPHLARFLFHPRNYYWNRITRAYHNYLAHSQRHIGLQIRSFSDNDADVNPRIFECLVNITGVLPDVIPKDEWMALLEGKEGRRHPEGRAGHVASISVMVASLHSHHMEYLRKIYQTGQPVDGAMVSFHQESADNAEAWGGDRMAQFEGAIIEMFLLSFSSDLFLSEKSTFGAIAAALGGLSPWYFNIRHDVSGDDWHKNNRSVCNRGTAETCLHGGPRNLDEKCPATQSHREEASKFLTHCWNQRGLQIIPLGEYVIEEFPGINILGTGYHRREILSLGECQGLCVASERCHVYAFSLLSPEFSGCWLKANTTAEREERPEWSSGIIHRG